MSDGLRAFGNANTKGSLRSNPMRGDRDQRLSKPSTELRGGRCRRRKLFRQVLHAESAQLDARQAAVRHCGLERRDQISVPDQQRGRAQAGYSGHRERADGPVLRWSALSGISQVEGNTTGLHKQPGIKGGNAYLVLTTHKTSITSRAECGCTHTAADNPLELRSPCHPHAGLDVSYHNGVLTMRCRSCAAFVEHIAVARDRDHAALAH